MFVERIISVNSGWSILTTRKEEWQEVLYALGLINKDFMDIAMRAMTEEFKNKNNSFSAYLYSVYNGVLKQFYHWSDNAPVVNNAEEAPDFSRTIKNGVLASIPGFDDRTGGDLISTLYLHIPYYFNSGALSVAVILIPTNTAIDFFLAHGIQKFQLEKLTTEEIYLEQSVKFNSLTSKAPVVLAFFSPTEPAEIAIEEITSLKIEGHTIERTIEFAPEHYQAGVGLLSYFGEVLRQKDPNTKAKVRIEQDGNTVRLRIESPSGDIETIEEELEKYALVISNKAAPESLFENRAYVIQLEHKLDVTKLELKQAYNTIALTDGLHSQRINNLEQQVTFLKDQVAAQLLQTGKVIELATQQVSSHERVQAALLAHAGVLFKDLLAEARGNQVLLDAITSLHQNLLSGITTLEVEDQIKQALTTVKQVQPDFLLRILKELESASYKAVASSSLGWVAGWIAQHAA